MKAPSRPVERPPGKAQSPAEPASERTADSPARWTDRPPGWLLFWAGLLLPQLVLLGPAMVGASVNLPVDLLATPHLYLPTTAEYQHIVPDHSRELLDLLLGFEDSREFSARELRAGRLPIWQPAIFAGAPTANWPKYSLFELPFYIYPKPAALAWIALFQALTCGLGMWLFLRRGLRLSYWPAAVAAWCAPLAGFMSTWMEYVLRPPACWLPWLLLLVRGCVKSPSGYSGVGLVIVTALTILSGASDVAGLTLLSAGLYAVWLLASERGRWTRWRASLSAVSALTFAWVLGFALCAPFLLPMYEYDSTGSRMRARAAGSEERPPVGVSAIPPLAVPDVYGNDQAAFAVIRQLTRSENIVESTSGACVGLLVLFWLAPLAWSHASLRRESIFFLLLVVAGVGWSLGLPGLVQIMRIRPLNLLSYNRWIFATALALLILAAIGMEALRAHLVKFHFGFVVPMLAAAGFGVWCLASASGLPEPLATQLETAIRRGEVGGISLEGLRSAQRTLTVAYAMGAALCLAAEVAWLTTFAKSRRVGVLRIALIGLIPGQLFWFAWAERRQADASLYFPPVAALQKIKSLPAGRIWGVDCLPPNLGHFTGLEDIRGYDAVDPTPFVRLFDLAQQTDQARSRYAATQEALPVLIPRGKEFKLHPVADLLNVRYLVLRTPPPIRFPVVVHEADYWVLENPHVLPRAFVPRSVRVVKDDSKALDVLRNPEFNPRETVVMFTDPEVADQAQGTASISYTNPVRASVDVDLDRDGMLVISDMWDRGWRAELDGVACPIHRVDMALRGLRVPSGRHQIELLYDPASLRLGFELSAAALLILFCWSGIIFWKSRRTAGHS